ncbi:MAG TPA: hypothetical protein VMU54_14595 [Planctomycetota bacterium]|nr:hypothetical protein [Planctomycetota bacterium]
MGSDGIVSTLAEQMLEAKTRATLARAKGKDARLIEAIDRSVRRTLGCIVQIRDPREVAMRGFSLVVNSAGEIQVRHRESSLPISSSYLRSLLAEAGVEPRPGQVILLDEVLVGALVEEALGAVSREQAQMQSAKSRLIQASLEVDSKALSGATPVERLPRDAA